jgi:hypothetical protein
VGADGIFSTVRAAKLGDDRKSLRYLGLMVVLGIAPCDHPGYSETVCQTLDGATRLYSMPFTRPRAEASARAAAGEEGGAAGEEGPADAALAAVGSGTTMWQLSFPTTEEDARTIAATPQSLREEAIRRCGGWHEPIPSLLRGSDFAHVTGYPCYDRPLLAPERLRGDRDAGSRVTLLGDAAHPMSPFKGQGANQALLDAVLLARAVYDSRIGACAKAWNDGRSNDGRSNDGRSASSAVAGPHGVRTTHDRPLPVALAGYEADMLRRSAVKVKHSAEAAVILHRKEALAKCPGQTRASVARAVLQGKDPTALKHS